MRRRRLAVLGGTFDHLHVGHHALVASAFRVGDEVAIGLTTGRYVAEHPKPVPGRIQPYAVRRAALSRWIRANYPRRKWRITPLGDAFGGSVDPRVGVLVVSRDTERGGRAVNRERQRLGRPPVPMVSVPLVLADDLEPVSSRRIRAKVIGPDGRRRASIRIGLTTSDPRDRKVAERAIARVFPRVQFVSFSPSIARRGLGRGKPARPGSRTVDRKSDLAVWVARRSPRGWTAVETHRNFRLRPRIISGSRPADLERGLVRLLRPRQ